MNKLIDPPVSLELLSNVYEDVFVKSYKTSPIVLLNFIGSGKYSEIKYLISQSKNIEGFSKDHLVVVLDLPLLVSDEPRALKDFVYAIKNHYAWSLNSASQAEIEKFLSLAEIGIDRFVDLIYFLTFTHGYRISLVLDGFDLLLNEKSGNEKLLAVLNNISKLNPMKIGFIYLVQYDYSSKDLEGLDYLSIGFSQNILFGKDYLFDKESAKRLFVNEETWKNHKFDKRFVDKAIDLCKNDPSTLKLVAVKALGSEAFEKEFILRSDIAEIYNLIGPEALNLRFNKIINSLSAQSLKSLKNDFSEPTDFLINTGLITTSAQKNLPLNDLFAHYININKENFGGAPVASSLDLKLILSAQELDVFNLLKSKVGDIVTREEIAEAMWGKNWEVQYSEWAVSRVLSSIRSKLKDSNYPSTIKSYKSQGVALK